MVIGPFKKMNLKFCQLIIFFFLTLGLSLNNLIVVGDDDNKNKVDSFDVENGGHFLYKCDEEKVTNNSSQQSVLSIPEILQVSHKPVGKLEYYSRKFNKSISSLFTFPLIPVENDGDGTFCSQNNNKNNDGEFKLKIPTLEKDQGGESGNIFFSFSPAGHLIYEKEEEGRTPEAIYFHPENYCVSKINPESIQVIACKSQCHIPDDGEEQSNKGTGLLCLPKCCPIGHVMSGQQCVVPPSNKMGWRIPNIYASLKNKRGKNPLKNLFPQFQYNYVNYHWNCSGKGKEGGRLILTSKELKILPNGRIYQKHPRIDGIWLSLYGGHGSRQFCMDSYLTPPTRSGLNKNETGPPDDEDEDRFVLLTCKDKLNDLDDLHLYPQLLFGITLTATLIHGLTTSVYFLLWDTQNVHGWTSLVLTSSQVFLNLFLCVLFAIFGFGHPETVLAGSLHPLCVGIGIFHHFTLICTFSWSTVYSFDAWSKIRSMTPRSRSKGKKRFLVYCSFGFGVPMLVVLIGILMEFGTTGDEDEDDDPMSSPGFVRPGYGKTCLIQHSLEYLFYVTIVILALFTINMLLALHTLKTVWEAKKGVKNFQDSNTKSSSMDNKSELVIKLFVLMGAFLIFELILAFQSPISISIYFAFLDLYRIFHALGLFWIFVCNKRMAQQLITKFPKLIQILPPSLSPKVKNAVTHGMIGGNNVTRESVA